MFPPQIFCCSSCESQTDTRFYRCPCCGAVYHETCFFGLPDAKNAASTVNCTACGEWRQFELTTRDAVVASTQQQPINGLHDE